MATFLAAELSKKPDPAAIALLSSSNPDVVARAALALGRVGDPTSKPLVRPLLQATDPRVRAMAAYSLGLLTDSDSAQPLVTLLTGDANPAVRYAAADALGRIVAADTTTGTVTVAGAFAVALGDKDPIVRGHAAANAYVFGNTPNGAALAQTLGSHFLMEKDPDVRWHEMWALYRGFAQVADREVLLAGLKDPNDVVRIEAVHAWAMRTDPDAATLVRPLLDDPSWRVQLQAGEALHKLANEPLTDDLKALPPGLHVPTPQGSPPPREPPLPHSPAQKPAAPTVAEVGSAPLYAPTTALGMNGPMPGAHPRVRIITAKGDVIVKLYPEWAPMTVASFLRLANTGYFDGDPFFRIVPDFVVQTGARNPNADPGFNLRAELNPVEERSGVIAMALSYDKGHAVRDSAGSQFYLTISPQLYLDANFTVFGEITDGFDVLGRLIESDKMVRVEQLLDG